MGSVRLSPTLELKIQKVATQRGVSRSEVFRNAIEIYCDTELESPTRSKWDDVIGIIDAPADGSARVSEYFAEGLMRK